MDALGELAKLQRRYDQLSNDYVKRGLKNQELNMRLQELISENATMKAMLCEHYEITPTLLQANIKLYRREQQVKDKQCIIKHMKEQRDIPSGHPRI